MGGALYAGTAVSPYDLYTMNTTTGVATLVIGTSGSQAADFWGLAPISSSAPKPSTLLQLGTGLAGMAGLWFRRRRS